MTTATASERIRVSRARADLAAWLRRSDAYDVLDDAVMGSLTEATVLNLFADFGIIDCADARQWFRAELNRTLEEDN